jgi:hypothetical protein
VGITSRAIAAAPSAARLAVAGPGYGSGLALATLAAWLVTAALGGFMLTTWLARGGLRRRRETGEGPPPGVILGHFALAITGLLAWIGYLATGLVPLAWAGAGVLMPVVGMGLATVTLWTPYPSPAARLPPGGGAGRGPAAGGPLPAPRARATALTDELLAQALTDDALAARLAEEVVASVRAGPVPARKPRQHLAALVPAGHGLAAMATILLATLTVASTL